MPHWFADWAVAIYDNHYWQRRPQRPIMAQVIECEFGHAQHDRAVGLLHLSPPLRLCRPSPSARLDGRRWPSLGRRALVDRRTSWSDVSPEAVTRGTGSIARSGDRSDD